MKEHFLILHIECNGKSEYSVIQLVTNYQRHESSVLRGYIQNTSKQMRIQINVYLQEI